MLCWETFLKTYLKHVIVIGNTSKITLLVFPVNYNFIDFFFQILKILQHSSVRGLSVVAFELEVVGYTIALAYCLHKGLPFSAYGELAFLLIQGMYCRSFYIFSWRWKRSISKKSYKFLVDCSKGPIWVRGKWEKEKRIKPTFLLFGF